MNSLITILRGFLVDDQLDFQLVLDLMGLVDPQLLGFQSSNK